MVVLLAGLSFGACSNDDSEQTTQPRQPRPLTIEVTENPLIGEGETRAAITTTSTLTAFNLNYVYGTDQTGSRSATKNGERKWTSGGGWPNIDGGINVNWYAYTDGSFNLTDDASKLPYINFTVDENSATQKDLLVATASGTLSGTGGNLSFTFDHACSALRFYAKKSTNLNGYTLSVSSIVLKNVVKQGKYYYGTGAWTLTDTRSYYTLLSSAKMLTSNAYELLNGSENDSYLFLIPQTLTAWDHSAIASATTQSYLELTCTITNTSTSTQVYSGTAYIPFAISTTSGNPTIGKGKKYDVKINIGKNSLYNSSGSLIINP